MFSLTALEFFAIGGIDMRGTGFGTPSRKIGFDLSHQAAFPVVSPAPDRISFSRH